jgi:ADP-heptose:LPS heptosyltransferase
MSARAGITGSVTLRPYLILEESEESEAAWARECIVVQSSGLAAKHPIGNKEWYPERFQAVVDALSREYEFIQVGSATDPPLAHVRDLRGKTSVRKSAAILHHARLYIGLEGFLMHLARATDCPSVIIFGGRTPPWYTGYVCNNNLFTGLPCAPCWRWNTCDFDRKCMADIAGDDVVAAVRDLLRKPRNPLLAETVHIVS